MDLWLLTEWRLIGILIAVIGFAYAFGTWRGKVNSVLEQLGESMKVVTTDLKSLRESMNEVKNDMNELKNEVKNDMNELKNEVKNDMNELKNEVKNDMNELKNEQKSLRKSVSEVKNEQKSLRKSVSKVENDIVRIQLHSTTLPLVETNSPLRLTEHGKKYSVDQSVKDWAEGHAMHLVEEAAGNPEFKIFEMCVAYVSDQFDEDSDFNEKIRASAYESGYEVGHLIKVYDVELRDAVLSKLGS